MELLPLVLGPNGSRMQQICNQNGITRVVVENARGFIRIVGTDPEMVARARRLLEVVSHEVRSTTTPRHRVTFAFDLRHIVFDLQS